MKYKNSFFVIDIQGDGTYLELYPPQSDGKKLEIKEVVNFISDHGLVNFSTPSIKAALEKLADKPLRIKVSDEQMEPFGESAVVEVSLDKMTAFIRFYPPSKGGSLMSKKDILGELQYNKISHGIQEKVIDVFMMARQYCLNIPIAKGTKPVLAQDTQIEYFFNTKPLAKPKLLEDGSVDFHELNLFTPCHKGDLLAKLTPHTLGAPGMDVFGKSIPQNKPKIKLLKCGRNIEMNSDKTTLTSLVDGNVSLTQDTVFVSDTYTVPADVDASTGDLDYDGNIVVTGVVKTGFTVRAKGDIQVNGVVEGATLIAGGNIVIKRGVQGMGKGKLVCGGDICAQFFESANVEAEGNVTAGSILHSTINSKGKVVVSGKKGFIVGGVINCQDYVEVNSIGNKMETQTLINVGVKTELYEEMKGLVSEVTEMNKVIEETSSYLNVYKEKLKKGISLSPENLKQIKQYNAQLDEVLASKKTKNERMVAIKSELDRCNAGKIRVLGYAYRGAMFFISRYSYTVKDKDARLLYKVEGGEIVTSNF